MGESSSDSRRPLCPANQNRCQAPGVKLREWSDAWETASEGGCSLEQPAGCASALRRPSPPAQDLRRHNRSQLTETSRHGFLASLRPIGLLAARLDTSKYQT